MVSGGGRREARERGREAWERRRRPVSTSVDLADRVALALPPEDAWRRLMHVEAVAACIPDLVPGSLERVGEHAFRGRIRKTAVGVTANWSLAADLRPSPDEGRLAVRLEGDEPRLGLRLTGSATLQVAPGTASPSDLDYRAHVEVTGRLTAAGAPMIRSAVDDIVRRFVASVGEVPPAPRGALRRLLVRLLRPVRRLLGLPSDRGARPPGARPRRTSSGP